MSVHPLQIECVDECSPALRDKNGADDVTRVAATNASKRCCLRLLWSTCHQPAPTLDKHMNTRCDNLSVSPGELPGRRASATLTRPPLTAQTRNSKANVRIVHERWRFACQFIALPCKMDCHKQSNKHASFPSNAPSAKGTCLHEWLSTNCLRMHKETAT